MTEAADNSDLNQTSSPHSSEVGVQPAAAGHQERRLLLGGKITRALALVMGFAACQNDAPRVPLHRAEQVMDKHKAERENAARAQQREQQRTLDEANPILQAKRGEEARAAKLGQEPQPEAQAPRDQQVKHQKLAQQYHQWKHFIDKEVDYFTKLCHEHVNDYDDEDPHNGTTLCKSGGFRANFKEEDLKRLTNLHLMIGRSLKTLDDIIQLEKELGEADLKWFDRKSALKDQNLHLREVLEGRK